MPNERPGISVITSNFTQGSFYFLLCRMAVFHYCWIFNIFACIANLLIEQEKLLQKKHVRRASVFVEKRNSKRDFVSKTAEPPVRAQL